MIAKVFPHKHLRLTLLEVRVSGYPLDEGYRLGLTGNVDDQPRAEPRAEFDRVPQHHESRQRHGDQRGMQLPPRGAHGEVDRLLHLDGSADPLVDGLNRGDRPDAREFLPLQRLVHVEVDRCDH